MLYTVIYDDDLCYHRESYFFTLQEAKQFCKINKHNWMRWKIKDEKGHDVSGGCNNTSYYGT